MDEQTNHPRSATGFSRTQKTVGAFAAYRFPFVSAIVASAALRDETDPERRKQLTTYRNASLAWGGACAVVGLVVLLIVLASISGNGSGGPGGGPANGACRGGALSLDEAMVEAGGDLEFESDDNVHWTTTVPCRDGGATSISVPRSQLPFGDQP